MCEPLVARMSAASFPMVCADAVPPAPGRACWALFDDDAAGARERGRLSENGSVCHVGLVQEDWWAGMVERRMSPGGHGNSGKTRANHGSGSQVLHTGTADFEDGSGAGNGSF